MTAISRLPATIDKLVEVLTDADLIVFDGPAHVDYTDDIIYVGFNGDPRGNWKQSDTRQDWSGSLGTARRDEDLDIICAVIASRSDNDVKAARDAAYDLLGTVESTLRANPGLGFSSPYVAGVRPRETFIVDHETGLACRITFIVSVKTRV